MVGKNIIFFAQRLRPCLHSCGAQNLLRLGVPINFDRCATTACAVSPTGSAWQLCSGNPSVATVSITHSTKRKPPKLGGFILCLCTAYLIQCDHLSENVTIWQTNYLSSYIWLFFNECYTLFADEILSNFIISKCRILRE